MMFYEIIGGVLPLSDKGPDDIWITHCVNPDCTCSKPNIHKHLHIYPKTETTCSWCFRCNKSFTKGFIVSKLLGVSYKEACRMLDGVGRTKVLTLKKRVENIVPTKGEVEEEYVPALPEDFVPFIKDFPLPYREYLIRRNIPFDAALSEGYGYSPDSFYSGRVIVPVRRGRELTGFVARATYTPVDKKSLYPKGFKSSKNVLYLDSVPSERMFMVEGCFDPFPYLYPEAGVIFGLHLSNDQMRLIKKRGIREVICLFDSGAYDTTIRIANTLSLNGFRVWVGTCRDGHDPNSMREDDMKYTLDNLRRYTRDRFHRVRWRMSK